MDALPNANEVVVPAVRRGLVARNALFLVVAKVLSAPISLFNNAIMARFLGAEDFGYWFVAQAYAAFAGLIVAWGQVNTLPSAMARDRSKASLLLGSGLVQRTCVAIAFSVVASVALVAMKPAAGLRLILILVFVQMVLGCLTATYQDVLRGFERTDVDALLNVLGPLFGTATGIVILVLGGRVPALVLGGICLNLLLSRIPRRALAASGVRTLSWSKETVWALTAQGWPFLSYAFANSLQPAIDAAFLSKLVPPEVVGWQAVATRLVGALIFPATAISASLYPTLCRLYAEDRSAYCRSTSHALRTSLLVVVPVAVGCALFPDLAIRVFSRRAYGAAEANLRILAIFIFALYFTLPLGTALLAAGGQRRWALVQCICVVVSVVLDSPLIHWFQRHYDNGGLGICTSTCLSECLMVVAAVWLLPRGILDKSVMSTFASVALGGIAMAALARGFASMTEFVTAPLSVVAYAATLVATGTIGRKEMGSLLRVLRRGVPS